MYWQKCCKPAFDVPGPSSGITMLLLLLVLFSRFRHTASSTRPGECKLSAKPSLKVENAYEYRSNYGVLRFDGSYTAEIPQFGIWNLSRQSYLVFEFRLFLGQVLCRTQAMNHNSELPLKAVKRAN